ncbi:TetR/AcrR family transcriptional regulator [Leptospira langatensis]|uniref:TetR/AcrR family transcriptional regulator n=2 Tax=Leptospira langatensis TaxID=2484983 RepID=A0A5F1ZZ57_9LEPT|nr:TetR/AcrR family transcriptional regulator [Leptospira langatensis]TGJ98355.1 TetR/AcrR family transcriptional regulator [Leptospira langatensis]TGL43269.1 TetR/AcrR family transcriptional regulator [Leptospira langatensis]
MATKLFMEQGYHAVTTAQIAKLANVSVPTLFNYFPNKESLVFDEDIEREERLLNAVLSRKKGVSILDALLDFGLKNPAFNSVNRKLVRDFRNFIKSTPELSHYERQITMRYESSLAKVLQKEAKNKLGDVEAGSIAHFILDAFFRASDSSRPQKTLESLFEILKNGWEE